MKEKEIERCKFFGHIYMILCLVFTISDQIFEVHTYIGLGFLFLSLLFRTLGAIFKKETE